MAHFAGWVPVLSVGLLALVLEGVTALNSTLYPREYADISCTLAMNEEGVCVYAYLCRDGVLNTDGAGIIDLRFGEDVCEDYFLRCCSKTMPCEDGSGTCVPKGKCGVDISKPQYSNFKSSDECDWSGYICCPSQSVQKGEVTTPKPVQIAPTKPPTTMRQMDGSIVPERCNEGRNICVPEGQCAGNADGAGIIQPRMGSCSSPQHLCCPPNLVKPNDGCAAIGGKCVPESQCPSRMEFDVRIEEHECPTEGHVCCTQGTNKNDTRPIGKDCFVGRGTCRESCKETPFRDRKNDCEGLICCPKDTTTTTPTSRTTTTTTTTTTTRRTPDTQTTTTTTRRTPVTDPTTTETCHEHGGICLTQNACDLASNQPFEECRSKGHVCCLRQKPVDPSSTTTTTTTTTTTEKPYVEPYESRGCGFRNEQGVIFKTINNVEGEAQYGEFPWVVGIFSESKLICGGALIDPEVVLTTADCVKYFRSKPEKLTIRAGEWDMRSNSEPIPYQERGVRLVKSHPAFKQSSLVNSIALVFLNDTFNLSHTIDTVCLPPQDFEIYNGEVTATGWGSTPKDRTKKQQILKSLNLPYNHRSDCERILRRALRKPSFKLDESFWCAGGEPDVDTCMGDAGSPVMFPIRDDFEGRWFAVGMVSWGIGCGRLGVPAAYTDIARFRDWIDEELRKEGLAAYNYDYHPQQRK